MPTSQLEVRILFYTQKWPEKLENFEGWQEHPRGFKEVFP